MSCDSCDTHERAKLIKRRQSSSKKVGTNKWEAANNSVWYTVNSKLHGHRSRSWSDKNNIVRVVEFSDKVVPDITADTGVR